jgi:hypothetical protein
MPSLSNIAGNAAALAIIALLVKPFSSWQAYADGVIDADGNVIHPEAKSEAWTMLHRLVARIKRLIEQYVPFGKSPLVGMAAAYMLVKECVESEVEPDNLESIFENINVSDISLSELIEFKLFYETYLNEDAAPANSVVNVAGIKPGDEPPAPKMGSTLLKRKKNVSDSGNPKGC